MCGRYTQTAAFDELALRFGVTVEDDDHDDLVPRYNTAPSLRVPVVVAADDGRRLVMARWGFRPAWLKGGALAPINAKAETVATSRMFREALRRYRCLVPADGFYEWKVVPGQKRKQPYYARLKGGGLFAFAGLWTPGHAAAGAPATCTIITTEPNELLAEIHNRMPVILERAEEDRWLDSRLRDAAGVLPCLRSLPAERMEVYPVSTLVSSALNEGPELVQPLSG
ncbi:MAG TPA: SOS response-associated peptidase [Terriglobales bacterium]|nr:SOS response-associated peptidase [Terriglobales bacterium]